MKQIIIIVTALVLSVFSACNAIEPEIVEANGNEYEMVPMTFTAYLSLDDELSADKASTKVEVGTVDMVNKKLSFNWKKGDEIAIYDNFSKTVNRFAAESDGASTTFSGTVPAGATGFIAIYPYSAANSVDVETGACDVDIPQIQHAVAGSFDPEALVAVGSASASDAKINFRLIGSLLSFSLDYDDVIQVQFSGSRPMTGNTTFTNAVGASGPTSISTGTPNYKNVTLANEDGSALTKDATYYVYVRHTGSSTHEGFTAKLITDDARVATRVASSNLTLARKTCYPLGKFSDSNVTFAYDRYSVYQAGFDVSIGGKTYNKSTYGDATLITDGTVFKTGMTGVQFVDASASISNTSEVTITSDVILASNDPEHPATYIGTVEKSLLLKSGSLVLDNLIVDLDAISTKGQFMTKKDNESNFSSLTLWQCDVKNIKRSLFAPNSSYLNNGIESVLINGCRLGTDAAVQLFAINSGAVTLAGYKDFTFTNNVLYSTTGNALQSYVFSTSASGIVESTCNQEVIMDNNLFYNIAASNGIFRTHYLKSIYIRNNILFAKDGSYSNNIKMFKANLNVAAASSVFSGASSNNYCYGNLGESGWSISDSACRGPLSNVTDVTTTPGVNPVLSFNQTTGEFVLSGDYSAYGPRLQPM